MESTPVLLQWLASISPSTFLSLSQASWYLLDTVGMLFKTFPQAHAYPAMLSLALKVVPITSTYIAMQPPPYRHAANSSSSRLSFEALRCSAARNNGLFGTGLLHLMSDTALHGTMSAEAQGLRTKLLVGPGTEPALLRLTAACRSLHSQHTANQKQRTRRSARRNMAGASSHSRLHSNSSAGNSAQEEAASLLLQPDHQLMVAQLGEPSVAAFEAYLKTERSGIAKHIAHCVDVLAESAGACREQLQLRNPYEANQLTDVTPAALHVSVEPFCLGSAAGLQLLLEGIGLLIAEGNGTKAVTDAFDLLLKSVTGVTEAERRVFLAARGGLLVQVFQLGLQADGERQQQQQLEGVMETEKGIMVFFILKIMAIMVAAPCNGETWASCRHVVHNILVAEAEGQGGGAIHLQTISISISSD